MKSGKGVCMSAGRKQYRESTASLAIRTMGTPEYGIYKLSSKCYKLYKALKDYTNEKEAIDDLIRLVNRSITEEDLLKESCFASYSK